MFSIVSHLEVKQFYTCFGCSDFIRIWSKGILLKTNISFLFQLKWESTENNKRERIGEYI